MTALDAAATPLATRGLGEMAVVEGLPGAVVSLFAVLTYLGDPWLVVGVATLLYVYGDRLGVGRRRGAFVLALAFGAVGLTIALKSWFALPRPPGAGVDGFGFPSGHAIGATVVWGGVALVVPTGGEATGDRLSVGRRGFLVGAGALASLVAVSRVVIGVHYLVDVAVGVAVGVALLGVVVRVAGGRRAFSGDGAPAVTRVFLVAVVLCLLALGVAAGRTESLLTAGAALGGLGGWLLVRPPADVPATGRTAAVSLAGLVGCLCGVGLVAAVEPAAPLALAATGLVVVGLLSVPRLAALTAA